MEVIYGKEDKTDREDGGLSSFWYMKGDDNLF